MTRTAPRQLQVGKVGELVPRVDAPPKVTGEFVYASDLIVPGMLWGHTLRSPHAHARIRSIDITEAVTMAGVHAVLTHDDVPGTKTYGLEFSDQPVLAIDRVLYHGEPVAVVLEYGGLTPQPLFVMGDPEGVASVLRDVIRPRIVYLAGDGRHLPAVERYYRIAR